jgi:hypothetical protein
VSTLLLAAVAIACSKAASAQTLADIVLLNGKIVTGDDRFTIAEALAIKGERILAVGSNVDVEKHKGALTRVVDLNMREGSWTVPCGPFQTAFIPSTND